MEKDSRILVLGSTGLVGSAVVRELKNQGHTKIFIPTSNDYNLCHQTEVDRLFELIEPIYVFNCAAVVGGILNNSQHQATFIQYNLLINTFVIKACYEYGVAKLINLSSSCCMPRDCKQPMKEEYIMTGELEPTNYGYATAKLAAMQMCKAYNEQYGTNFLTVIPPNLFGFPNDNFSLTTSHFIPAMIRKFDDAKTDKKNNVTLWGTGNPIREVMYVDDLAEALIFIANNINAKDINDWINIGTGRGFTIKTYAEMIQAIVEYKGEIVWDENMPDGMPKKVLDISKISSLGWKAKTQLFNGLVKTYGWYKFNKGEK